MLSLKNKEKRNMIIEFTDGKIISVLVPRKKMLEQMEEISELMNCQDGKSKAINNTYEFLAIVLSDNKENEKITVEYLSEAIDFDDVNLIFNEYTNFVKGISQIPN